MKMKRVFSFRPPPRPASMAAAAQGFVAKTTNGKISRSANRRLLLAGELRMVHEWMDDAYAASKPAGGVPRVDPATVEVLEEGALAAMGPEEVAKDLAVELSKFNRLPPEEIRLDTPLMHCGIGSLDVAQFQQVVCIKFAVEIPDEFFFRPTTTLRAIAEAVKNGGRVPEPAPEDVAEGGAAGGGPQEVDAVAVNCPCLLGFRRCCRRLRGR